jgi:hypothetical protein
MTSIILYSVHKYCVCGFLFYFIFLWLVVKYHWKASFCVSSQFFIKTKRVLIDLKNWNIFLRYTYSVDNKLLLCAWRLFIINAQMDWSKIGKKSSVKYYYLLRAKLILLRTCQWPLKKYKSFNSLFMLSILVIKIFWIFV